MEADFAESTEWGRFNDDVEKRPSGLVVVRDNFDHGLNPAFWSTKRIKEGRYSYGQVNSHSALRIDLQTGDKQSSNSVGVISERSEISENPNIRLSVGVEVWYCFSFLFPKDFPTLDNRTVFAQWKQHSDNDCMSFLHLKYIGGRLVCKIVDATANKGLKFSKGREWRGAWHKLVINYRLDPNNQGYVHAFLDDEEFVNYMGGMGYKSSEPLTYFKMGLYRDQVEPTQTIFFANYGRRFKQSDLG